MNKYSGSNFDDFLREEGIFEEVDALTEKRLEALRAGEVVEIDDTSDFSEDLTGPVDRFFQWVRQVVHSFFPSPLAFGTAGFGVLVLVIGGFYFGNRYFGGGVPIPAGVPVPAGVARENGIVPSQIEPQLVRGVGKELKASPFGFGAFPKIPTDFPDQNIWNVVEKRSVHDPDGARTLELLARVRIKLWEEGKRTKGIIMDPSSGLVYSDPNIKILPRTSPDLPKYDTYFDEGVIPPEGIVVEFLKDGIDPYEFLNLPR